MSNTDIGNIFMVAGEGGGGGVGGSGYQIITQI